MRLTRTFHIATQWTDGGDETDEGLALHIWAF